MTKLSTVKDVVFIRDLATSMFGAMPGMRNKNKISLSHNKLWIRSRYARFVNDDL